MQLKGEQAKCAQIEQKLQSSGNPGGDGKVLDDSGALEISGQCLSRQAPYWWVVFQAYITSGMESPKGTTNTKWDKNQKKYQVFGIKISNYCCAVNGLEYFLTPKRLVVP